MMNKVNVEMKMNELRNVGNTVGVKAKPGVSKIQFVEMINVAIDEMLEVQAQETVIELEEVIEVKSQDEEVKEIIEDMKELADDELFYYEFLYRGLSIGAQPKGFVKNDETYGKFGAVAYTSPLSEYDIESYELRYISDYAKQQPVEEQVVVEEQPVVELEVDDVEEVGDVELYIGGYKYGREQDIELLEAMIYSIKDFTDKRTNDIEYFTIWLEYKKTKNDEEICLIKLKNTFEHNTDVLEFVESFGFSKNRVHFDLRFPVKETSKSDNERMFEAESKMSEEVAVH